MSFLDERENPPRAPGVTERPRRDRDPAPGPAGRPRRPPPRGPRPPRRRRGTDQRTLIIRRSIGIGIGVLFVVLTALLVRGCLEERQQRAFEGYLQEESSLIAESAQESEALFELLDDPGDLSAVDVQNRLNSFSVDAQQVVERARSVEPPDELSDGHGVVVQALELRQEGLEGIAQDLPAALGDEQRDEAIEAIARHMQSFLASDVIYSEQAVPRIEETLEREELADVVSNVPDSEFLPDIEWLEPGTVRDAVDGIRAAEDADEDERAAPGTHGTGIVGVTVTPSGVALVDGTPVEVAASNDLAFEVQIQNQGENDEEEIPVQVVVKGPGETLRAEATLEAIAAGETQTVSVPLEQRPPAAEEAEVKVRVEPVAGEESADNNVASYPVLFTDGG